MAGIGAFSATETERIVAAVMAHRGVTRESAERVVNSIAERSSKRNPELEAQWTTTFHAVCQALVSGQARPIGLFVSVFWIRLYGVITDLWSRSERAAELHDMLEAAGRQEPFLVAMAGVYSACNDVRESLTDDELVFAAFLRHVHAHVYQSGFEYSIEPGKPFANLRTKQMVRTTRRHVGIDEAHAIVNKICLTYSNDDSAVAVSFAQKIWRACESLKAAMDKLTNERTLSLAPRRP